MRVHRLISMLLLIESKGKVKAQELAEKLEISPRTVYRDVDILCEAGVPITTTSGPNGGIHLMEGWNGGIRHFQEEEVIGLYLSAMGIQPDRGTDMATKLNNAMLKLQKNMSPKISDGLNRMKKRFHFDETPWWGDGPQIECMDTQIHAMLNLNILKIAYKKVNGEASVRRVRPYGFVVKEKADWYMVAYCEKSQAIKTFKCERIIECESLDEPFILPEDFSIDEYWNQADGAFKDLCALREQYPVV